MSNNNYKYKRYKKPKVEDNYNPPYSAEILAENIQTLGLNEETYNLISGANYVTLLDVLKKEEKDFYKIKTFNKKNLINLKISLKRKSLALKPTPPKPEEEKDKEVAKKNNEKPKAKEQTKEQKQPNTNNRLDKKVDRSQEQKNKSFDNKPKDKNNNKGKKDRNQRFEREEKQVLLSPRYNITPTRPPKVLVQVEKEAPDMYLKMNKSGKWGFKDRHGKQAVAPIYDEVFNYHENLCCVQLDEKFGFINREGEEIIPITYDCATSFSEGYACVFVGEKCGYINDKNEFVIPCKFDAGTPIKEGECRVKLDEKWGELHLPTQDEEGKIVGGVNDIRWIV